MPEPTFPSDPDPLRQPRPHPCPQCFSTKGYSRVGKFRVQCLDCNALLKNNEVNLDDQEPQ